MKKINLILLIFICLIFTGCFNKKEKKVEEKSSVVETVCRGEEKMENGITANVRYELKSQDDKVLNLKSIETIESDDISFLEETKKSIENTYSIYSDIKYYEYDVNINENKLISTVNIDYDKIDLNKLVSIDEGNKNIIVDNRVSLSYLKNMYESLGSVCIDK